MRHIDYQKRISLLVDGALDESATMDLLAHLEQCPQCMRVYEQMESLNNNLANVKISLPECSLANTVKARIARVSESSGFAWNFSFLRQVPIWALIAILAVGVGDMAGKTLAEALSAHTMSSSLENLIQNNGESLSDALINFGQGENSQ